jgi:hypothetical protein
MQFYGPSLLCDLSRKDEHNLTLQRTAATDWDDPV